MMGSGTPAHGTAKAGGWRADATPAAGGSAKAGRAEARPASIDGVLCDARTATVPVYDDGFLRGDGAFEFVRCYAGKPFTLVEHLDRMEKTCATIRLPFPRARFEAEIAALLASVGSVSTDLRIVLTRGGRRILILEPFLEWPPAHLALVADSPRRILGGAKTLSYAGNMLAKRIAEERGFWEALLTTPDGRIMEVQQAAFFWATPDGELCTPPLGEGGARLHHPTRRHEARGRDGAHVPHRGRARGERGVPRRQRTRGAGRGGDRGPGVRRPARPVHAPGHRRLSP